MHNAEQFVAKYFEAVLLIIVVIWLAMFLPMVVYLLVSG